MDVVEPAFIAFMDHSFGVLHFGYLYANLEYVREEPDKVAFSFHGDDAGRAVFGRGWVKKDSQGLYGHLFFHEGEHSTFEAIQDGSALAQNNPGMPSKGKQKSAHGQGVDKRASLKERAPIPF